MQNLAIRTAILVTVVDRRLRLLAATLLAIGLRQPANPRLSASTASMPICRDKC